MNRKTLYLAVIAFLIVAASCNKTEKGSGNYPEMTKAAWLVGKWQNQIKNGVLTETWTKVNDSTYTARSYFVKTKGDTLHLEAITLAETQSGVTYTPVVQGQNNNQPVSFTLISSTDNELVFENPRHDYPNKIVYRKVSTDSIVAEISGTQQGKPFSERYPMGKSKD
jgi:hypothetical protein